MKQEELSIGDWVNVNRAENVAEGRYREWQEICIVVAISECFVSVRYGDDEFDWEEVSMDAVEPIPITPEILEKNGWELRPTGYVFHIDGGKSYDNTLWYIFNDNTFVVENAEFSIKYIHELQHALRLCKIEKKIEL